MSKLLLLWLIFIVRSLFLLIPRVGPTDYFLFSDMKLYLATHIYFIGERVTMIILALIITVESSKYRQYLQIFLLLMIADLVDYLLCYNEVWFYYYEFPVSMNMLKVTVFGLVILKAWVKQLQ